MRRGFRAAAWILLALAVLAVGVMVPVDALRAHGTAEFNRWVGLANVAAVPLAAGGLILMFWNKITVSVTRLRKSDKGQERQASGELIRVRAEGSGPAIGTNLGMVIQTGTVNLG